MFVPCTALLYDSTAATRTIKLSTTLLSISCAIRLISFLMMSSLACGLFSQTLSLRYPLRNSQAGWDLGNKMARGYWFDVKWVCPMGSYAWGIQVLCSRWWFEMRWSLISRTEHLNTSGITSHRTDWFNVKPITPGHPIPKISTRLAIFWEGTWKTEFVKTIHWQERTSSEKKSGGLHMKCSIELWTILLFEFCSYSSTVHGTNIVLITEKV